MHEMGMRQKLHRVLDMPHSSRAAFAFFTLIITVIFISVVSFFLATTEGLEGSAELQMVENVCTVVFTIELAARIFVGTLDVRGLLLCDFCFWIDALVLVPSYAAWFGMSGDGSLRLLKSLKVARTLKLMRMYSGWRVLIIALNSSWRAIIVPGFAMLITTTLLSGLLFVLEEPQSDDPAEVNEDAFEDALDALW